MNRNERNRRCNIAAGMTFLALVALPAGALAAERMKAEVSCTGTGQHLTYECVLRLADARTGQPVENAQVSVGADMPSMPMAHSVRPVDATPGRERGTYAFRIPLEMHGNWALRIRVKGHGEELMVRVLRFEEGRVVAGSR